MREAGGEGSTAVIHTCQREPMRESRVQGERQVEKEALQSFTPVMGIGTLSSSSFGSHLSERAHERVARPGREAGGEGSTAVIHTCQREPMRESRVQGERQVEKEALQSFTPVRESP